DVEEDARVEPGGPSARVSLRDLDTPGAVGIAEPEATELRSDHELALRERDVEQRAEGDVDLDRRDIVTARVLGIQDVESQLAVDRGLWVGAATEDAAQDEAGAEIRSAVPLMRFESEVRNRHEAVLRRRGRRR